MDSRGGNRAQSRRARDVDVEPGEQDPTPPGQLATVSTHDSCVDLTEDTATGSGGETERDTALVGAAVESDTPRRGPLRKPVPSQVVMAAARTRAERKEKQRAQATAALSDTASSSSTGYSSSTVRMYRYIST